MCGLPLQSVWYGAMVQCVVFLCSQYGMEPWYNVWSSSAVSMVWSHGTMCGVPLQSVWYGAMVQCVVFLCSQYGMEPWYNVWSSSAVSMVWSHGTMCGLPLQELLSQHDGVRGELEAQMAETQQEIEVLSRAVGDMGEVNEALKAENAELQTQLHHKGKQPMSRSVRYGAMVQCSYSSPCPRSVR